MLLEIVALDDRHQDEMLIFSRAAVLQGSNR